MTPVTELHPWCATPEALQAAINAVGIPMSLLPVPARRIGPDELESQALVILTECALPPLDRQPTSCAVCGGSLDSVRAGAKFCSTTCRTTYAQRVHRSQAEGIPPRTSGHIGSMWGWPEDERAKYAVREIGYVLNNHVRTHPCGVETPSFDTVTMADFEDLDD